MKKINYSEIADQLVIDVRQQVPFQNGSLLDAINLNLKNLPKYITHYLNDQQEIVMILPNELDVAEIEAALGNIASTQNFAYLYENELPESELITTETISASDFLQLEDSDYVLLDVRDPEMITRPAPEKKLQSLSLRDLITQQPTFDKNKTIYALCGGGNSATSAASILQRDGYKVKVIEGGMKAVDEAQQ